MNKLNKSLTHSITIMLFILTTNHYYRHLNYKPLAVILFAWIIVSFIIIRLEDSKFQ